jgi:hypothetical protein
MNQPSSEPAREQRVEDAPASVASLFSHTEIEAPEHRLAPGGGDWRATPFSGEPHQQEREHQRSATAELPHEQRTTRPHQPASLVTSPWGPTDEPESATSPRRRPRS